MPKQYKILRSISVYPNTYEAFKDACNKDRKSISEVLEQFMKDYITEDSVNSEVDVFGDETDE